jgi:hypothetical protein
VVLVALAILMLVEAVRAFLSTVGPRGPATEPVTVSA